jgi:hypothetical protein
MVSARHELRAVLWICPVDLSGGSVPSVADDWHRPRRVAFGAVADLPKPRTNISVRVG